MTEVFVEVRRSDWATGNVKIFYRSYLIDEKPIRSAPSGYLSLISRSGQKTTRPRSAARPLSKSRSKKAAAKPTSHQNPIEQTIIPLTPSTNPLGVFASPHRFRNADRSQVSRGHDRTLPEAHETEVRQPHQRETLGKKKRPPILKHSVCRGFHDRDRKFGENDGNSQFSVAIDVALDVYSVECDRWTKCQKTEKLCYTK